MRKQLTARQPVRASGVEFPLVKGARRTDFHMYANNAISRPKFDLHTK